MTSGDLINSASLPTLTLGAAWRPRHTVAGSAAVATPANGVPHFGYHALTSPDRLRTSERTASLVALASFIVVAAFIILFTRRHSFDRQARR